ncbi:MAG: type VI secretion system membrane subunit TssM [Paracoccaceae bacterium]
MLSGIPVRRVGRLLRNTWVRRVVTVLAIIGLVAAIWFGFEMTGWAPLVGVWTRLGVIAALLGFLALYYGLRWRSRRRAAQDLEDSLMPDRVGDGAVLAERMDAALATLKRTGGKTYLYDLPWYIIIGPPGAGKTTALRFSGIEFPAQSQLADQASGFGGTRNCEWWFAEDAVLIDTAGRYTTQDSDTEADRTSWAAFLDLLKKGRPDQPINGVILAFSVEDMLRGTPEEVSRHAEIVRARLAEIHETLRIDFPVYVLFTKADLIAGFREYFASFNQTRRNGVWGVTFQTTDRRETTHDKVGTEFDALMTRLGDEVIDRMNEEPDAISRIAIFGLPGQMAMLREGVVEFLRKVFEPTRYKSNAILRGFYFSSGTQEGTPIDQVLGRMSRDAGAAGFQPDFMSGKGKSFFLRDLLEKVIFAERDWVNYDRGAVRRVAFLRALLSTVIVIVTTAAMGAFGYSFWQNSALVRDAQAGADAYRLQAQVVLSDPLIDDPDPTPILEHLKALRQIPGGRDNPRVRTFWEGFGLSRHAEVTDAAEKAYSDGLERMLRPRMMLYLQQEIPQLIADGKVEAAYEPLRIYLLLGGQGPISGDDAIKGYFAAAWQRTLNGASLFDARNELEEHLSAMLELDGDRTLTLLPDEQVVWRAREAIASLSLEDQAWAAIQSGIFATGIPAFNLVGRVGGRVEEVFRHASGGDLADLGVPALYTYEGYWGFFLTEIASAEESLRQNSWVLGAVGERANYEQQLENLENVLFDRYRLEFKLAWKEMFDQLAIARMSADGPAYDRLSFVASETNSPLRELVEAVDEETRLTRLYEELDNLSAEDAALLLAPRQSGESLGGNLGSAMLQRLRSRGGLFERVVLDYLSSKAGGKIGNRVGVTGALEENRDRRRAERITSDFEAWHAMLAGQPGQAMIYRVLSSLDAVRDNRLNAGPGGASGANAALNQALTTLTRNNASLPDTVGRMLSSIEGEFRSVAEDATLTELSQKLVENVTLFCRDNIEPFYPFANSRSHLPPAIFGQFFAPGGVMDQFYANYLQPHVIRTADGLAPDPASRISARLSPETLRQFDRAQRIQQAFFAGNSPDPRVRMSIRHLSSSPSVELATLALHGQQIVTLPNSTPVPFEWPGNGPGAVIELQLSGLRAESPRDGFSNGRWDIVNFLRRARKVSENVVEVTRSFDGVFITYRLEFDSPTVPFLMPELSEFSCPESLE